MNFKKLTDYLGFIAFWLTIQLCRFLPFSLLYGLSYILYVIIYYLIPFRRKIALNNLQRAFPALSIKEIHAIYKQHVRFVCDMAFETLKGFTLSSEDMSRHWRVLNPEIMQQYQNQSVILISSHYGNWEWGVCLSGQINKTCINIYKSLRNPVIDKYMKSARRQIGGEMVSVKESARYFLSHRNDPYCYILIADQHPGGANQVHWMSFLHQDTAFIVGPEKYAKSFDYPVIYVAIDYVKRGYYDVTIHPISTQPKSMANGEITENAMRILEQQIRNKPAYWLWGHKRWKLKKPV